CAISASARSAAITALRSRASSAGRVQAMGRSVIGMLLSEGSGATVALEVDFKSRDVAAMATEPLTIGQVADRAGIATSRIRYYERIGVLPPAERVAGRRRYGEETVRRLSLIDAAQRAGLT